MKLLLVFAAACCARAFAATAILPVDSSSVNVKQSGNEFAYSIQQNRGAVALEAVQPAPAAAPAAITSVTADRPAADQAGGRRSLTQALIDGEQLRLKGKNEAIKGELRAQAQAGAVLTGAQLIEKGHLLGLRGIELRNLQVELFPTYIVPRYYYDIYDLTSNIPYIIY